MPLKTGISFSLHDQQTSDDAQRARRKRKCLLRALGVFRGSVFRVSKQGVAGELCLGAIPTQQLFKLL